MLSFPFLKLMLYVFVVVANSFLAIIVYQNNRKSATNIIFGLLSIFTSLWLGAMYFSTVENPFFIPSLFWVRATVFLAVPQSVMFFLLAHTIPKTKILLNKKLLFTIIIVSVAMMVFTASPYVFQDVQVVGGVVKAIPAVGIGLFGLFNAVFSLIAVIVLVKKLIVLKGIERQQVKYVLFGIIGMLGLIIATILIPVALLKISSFVQYSWTYVLFFLVLTAIAILRYHLFDIKIIATEAFTFLLVAILVFEGASSNNIFQVVYKLLFALLAACFGYLLVNSVRKEIKQRYELEKLTSQLQLANAKLKELDKQKTDFLSIAAHQLRTPMSISKGFLELLEDGAYGKTSPEMLKVFSDMDTSNEHLIKLIDQFLDISRIEQGRTKYDFKVENIQDLVDGVVKELYQRARDNGLKLVWKKDTNIKSDVSIDSEKIRHVVFNFIDNAIKYSESGEIKINLESKKGHIIVTVKDSGLGFGPEDQGKFFQKFYRGENVKGVNVGGTGIGLYVCRMFVEEHKGKVWAKSAGRGKGSEFGFSLPVKSGLAGSVAGDKSVVVVEK